MNIYEFITPSDAITFETDDDKIAYVCGLLLGNGKAGTRNTNTGESLDTMLMFAKDPEKDIEEYLGEPLKDFVDKNKQKVAECFLSFAYGSVSDRQTYNDAIQTITDPGKLKEFKDKHEDKNRSSMNQWVKGAWEYGEKFIKSAQDKK